MPAHPPIPTPSPATHHRHLGPRGAMPRRRSLPLHHRRARRVLTLVRGAVLVLALVLSVAASPTPGTPAAPPIDRPPTAGSPTVATTAVDTASPGRLPQRGGRSPLPPATRERAQLCALTDLGGCVSGAIDTFLQSVVADALNPLLGMLSDTLLTTPTPDQLPQLRELWDRSWQIVLTVYSLFILLAGILLMGYESVQTRYSVRDIAPRLVLGFLAGALSLTVAGFAVDTANALATALLARRGRPAQRRGRVAAAAHLRGHHRQRRAVPAAARVRGRGRAGRGAVGLRGARPADRDLDRRGADRVDVPRPAPDRGDRPLVVAHLRCVSGHPGRAEPHPGHRRSICCSPRAAGFPCSPNRAKARTGTRRCRPCSWSWRCCSSCAGSRSGCWPAAGSDRAGP